MKFSTATTITNTCPLRSGKELTFSRLYWLYWLLLLALLFPSEADTIGVFGFGFKKTRFVPPTFCDSQITGNISSSKKSIFRYIGHVQSIPSIPIRSPSFILNATTAPIYIAHCLISLRWISGAVGRCPHQCQRLGVSIGASSHGRITSSI